MITKNKDDVVIDGVCAGIANYLGINPWWVRIWFILMLNGGGLIGYVILMVLMEEK